MTVERYGSSKTDVIVKLVLVFFISLLSFSIGTFVGKKFSDNQHKISQLEPQPGESKDDVAATDEAKGATADNREVASVPTEGTDVKPKDALNDDEIKKLAEEFVADDDGKKPTEAKPTEASTAGGTAAAAVAATAATKEETKTVAAAEVPRAPTATAGATATGNPAATRVVAGKTPEPEVTETPKAAATTSRIPQSLPKELAATAIGKFTVQVASYPTEAEAEKMASDLKNKGFSAFYISAQIKDKTWYRVSVGIFTTQKEAEAYKADLIARAKVTSAIVQKITK